VPDLQESIHSSGVDDSETMGSVANWREIAITLIIRIVFLLFRTTVSSAHNSTPNQRVASLRQLSSRSNSTPTFFFGQSRVNTNTAQLNSASEASAPRVTVPASSPAENASSCQLLLLSYYDVSFQSSLSPNPAFH
jgi:hypothetical protein